MEESESISEENGEENKETKVTMPTAQNYSLPTYTTVENLMQYQTSTEPIYDTLNPLPVYTYPKTTMLAPLVNLPYSQFSNPLVQPAQVTVPNVQMNYSPQVSNASTIDNMVPLQPLFSTTQASTPLNQAN